MFWDWYRGSVVSLGPDIIVKDPVPRGAKTNAFKETYSPSIRARRWHLYGISAETASYLAEDHCLSSCWRLMICKALILTALPFGGWDDYKHAGDQKEKERDQSWIIKALYEGFPNKTGDLFCCCWTVPYKEKISRNSLFPRRNGHLNFAHRAPGWSIYLRNI